MRIWFVTLIVSNLVGARSANEWKKLGLFTASVLQPIDMIDLWPVLISQFKGHTHTNQSHNIMNLVKIQWMMQEVLESVDSWNSSACRTSQCWQEQSHSVQPWHLPWKWNGSNLMQTCFQYHTDSRCSCIWRLSLFTALSSTFGALSSSYTKELQTCTEIAYEACNFYTAKCSTPCCAYWRSHQGWTCSLGSCKSSQSCQCQWKSHIGRPALNFYWCSLICTSVLSIATLK